MSANTRPMSAYRQVYETIRGQITRGELRPGDKLATVRDAADSWGFAPGTVTRAYRQLQAEGYTVSRPGSQGGTFVTDSPPRNAVDDFSTARATGRIYGGTRRAKILSARIIPASDIVANMLNLDVGALVVRRERITYAVPDERPLTVSVSYHDAEFVRYAPKLVQTERIPQGTPQYIEEHTGHVGTEVVERPYAVLATDTVAAQLDITPGSPVLMVDSTLTTDDGVVIEYGESITTVPKVYRRRLDPPAS